jgi:hypothetical protein
MISRLLCVSIIVVSESDLPRIDHTSSPYHPLLQPNNAHTSTSPRNRSDAMMSHQLEARLNDNTRTFFAWFSFNNKPMKQIPQVVFLCAIRSPHPAVSFLYT